MDLCYEVCPSCLSPDFEDSGEYYKCNDCESLFEFPEEVPIKEVCQSCGEEKNIGISEVNDDGSCIFICYECTFTWEEEQYLV